MRKKTKFSENRSLAWTVFAVVVALTVVFSGGGGLRTQRKAASDVFYYGANNDGLCIANDMNERIAAARNLADLAGRYASVEASFATAVNTAASAAEADAKSGDLASLATENASLGRAVEQLYTELENTALSETDSTFALSQYKEFTSRGLTISRDTYNARAEAFNEVIGSFPASVVARLSGVSGLGLFR